MTNGTRVEMYLTKGSWVRYTLLKRIRVFTWKNVYLKLFCMDTDEYDRYLHPQDICVHYHSLKVSLI